jgi:hypothetical protein
MCDIFYDDEKVKIDRTLTHYTNIYQYIDFLPAFGIKEEFRKDLEDVILYFLEQSPLHMIIFLPRYQGDEEDVIHGVFAKDEFFHMLDNRLVKFNHCYIIGGSNVGDELSDCEHEQKPT